MTLAPLVVYAGFYLFLVFFAICLATGLYYIAEIVEEYTRLTRKVINYAIKVIIGLHLVLLVWDRLPVLCVALGVGAHVCYYRMLKTFPYISLTSVDFIASASLLVISNILWFRFFLRDPRCAYVSVEWMLGFMLIMLWIVPFALFISMAANESVLPGGGAPYPAYARVDGDASSSHSSSGGKRSRSTFLNFFNFMRKKKDALLPQVTSRLPPQYQGQFSGSKVY
ncbi:hypothetical protein R1sor_017868 [Riccia sorocarpa]|uniref:Transmembrane adaptor Erv26 n=1 Tax=Riccia sorocarpa TaxID=122646 RepID=A0ABD3I8I8_9MARC